MPEPESTQPSKKEEPKEGTDIIVKKLIENLEETYKGKKAQEIEDLYNAIVTGIGRIPNAHISNVLTALELVKHELINQKLGQIRREQQQSTA